MYGKMGATVAAAMLVMSGAAQAIDLTLGAGAAYTPDYQGSEDYVAVPLWNIRVGDLYHSETYVQVVGTSLSSNLLPSDHFRLGLVGGYRADYDGVDNNKVQDVKNAQSAFLLGPTLGYDFLTGPGQDLAIELDAVYDVAHGNGGVLTPRLRGKTVLMPGLVAEGRLQTSWGSDDYMGNWYGVNDRDATRSGLDSYNASEGIQDVTLGGSISWQFMPKWSLTGIASIQRLMQDAEDSPIVADEGSEIQAMGGLLVNYAF